MWVGLVEGKGCQVGLVRLVELVGLVEFVVDR